MLIYNCFYFHKKTTGSTWLSGCSAGASGRSAPSPTGERLGEEGTGAEGPGSVTGKSRGEDIAGGKHPRQQQILPLSGAHLQVLLVSQRNQHSWVKVFSLCFVS